VVEYVPMFRLLFAAALAIGFISLISPIVQRMTEPSITEPSTFLDKGPASLLGFWKDFVDFSKETHREYERLTNETKQRIDDVQTGVELIQEGKELIEQGVKGRD